MSDTKAVRSSGRLSMIGKAASPFSSSFAFLCLGTTALLAYQTHIVLVSDVGSLLGDPAWSTVVFKNYGLFMSLAFPLFLFAQTNSISLRVRYLTGCLLASLSCVGMILATHQRDRFLGTLAMGMLGLGQGWFSACCLSLACRLSDGAPNTAYNVGTAASGLLPLAFSWTEWFMRSSVSAGGKTAVEQAKVDKMFGSVAVCFLGACLVWDFIFPSLGDDTLLAVLDKEDKVEDDGESGRRSTRSSVGEVEPLVDPFEAEGSKPTFSLGGAENEETGCMKNAFRVIFTSVLGDLPTFYASWNIVLGQFLHFSFLFAFFPSIFENWNPKEDILGKTELDYRRISIVTCFTFGDIFTRFLLLTTPLPMVTGKFYLPAVLVQGFLFTALALGLSTPSSKTEVPLVVKMFVSFLWSMSFGYLATAGFIRGAESVDDAKRSKVGPLLGQALVVGIATGTHLELATLLVG